MTVVPCDLGAYRRFTLVTIALALLGVAEGDSAAQVRAQLSPQQTFEEGWPALRRWLEAIGQGRLLRWIRGVSELSGRAIAERTCAVLAEASGIDVRSASRSARVRAGVMSVRLL